VAAPSAQSISALNGCWSYTWQGQTEKWYPANSKTILQAITEKVGKANVFTSTVTGFDAAENYSIPAMLAQAQKADVIVLCIGENAYAETPGNITDLALAKEQTELVKAAQATGKPVILVLTTGRPRLITDIEPLSSGILMAYWSGKKTAEAVADVLFGDYNPSGILPFSYPRYAGEILTYDRKVSEDLRETMAGATMDGYDPLFAFGHGLSYTSFEYSNLQLSSTTISGAQKLEVAVTVKNTGKLSGKHCIELYSKDNVASIVPASKRLRAFTKENFAIGESKIIKFVITVADLAFVNAKLQTVTEAGTFELMVGNQKATVTVK
jgi:beta-glucosidase